MDPEQQRPVVEKQLANTTVHNITWRGVTVTVNDRKTKHPSTIVDNVEGIVKSGSSIPRMNIPRTEETDGSVKGNAAQ
jgi:hypothetical protein